MVKKKSFGFFLGILLLLFSCNNDDGDTILDKKQGLMGTKWTTTNWDYSLGDDYIGIHNEMYHLFFHSTHEGVLYYGRKDNYSDQGSSSNRSVCHFKYNIKGDKVLLEYITDEIIAVNQLLLKGNTLTANNLKFGKKQTITSEDSQWLNTIRGTSGMCFWYSDMNRKLWITGKGTMGNYTSYEFTPWASNNRTPNKVIVKEGVTSIGSYAFANPSISEVELPKTTLNQICEFAFSQSVISTICLNRGITTIGNNAFADCKNLKTIKLSESITTIGEAAFSKCTSLKDIKLPENIQEIGEAAFYECKSLNKVNIPEKIVSIGNYAFHNCLNLYLSELNFGSNLRTVGDFAFFGTNVSSVTFKEGVQSIGVCAFYCGISNEILLPNSLNTIGATAFEGSYKKIVIGAGINTIGENAFICDAASGEMYVNLSTPPSTGKNLIVYKDSWESLAVESRWTLYVPKSSKSTYLNKSPWNRFKSVVENGNLEEGNENGNDDKENNNDGGDETTLGYVNGYEYVDLGLSVKWATTNLGATKPEECGDYFAWGATRPTYDPIATWRHYEHCNGNQESCKNIGANISGTKYDAATVIMGKDWRIPTLEEWKELLNKCDFEWSSVNGVKGIKVIGPNGKSIFLPAGGAIYDYGKDYESEGNYWTSTHDYSGEIYQAEYVRFYYYNNSVEFNPSYSQKTFRHYCLSVRAVTD